MSSSGRSWHAVPLSLAGTLLLLASCSQVIGIPPAAEQGTCTGDEHCAPGYACLLEVCRNGCTEDAQCGSGSRCLRVLNIGACLPVDEGCGAGCPDGTQCQAGVCRTECSAAADCAGGQECRSGTCIGTNEGALGGGGSGGSGGSTGQGASGAGAMSSGGTGVVPEFVLGTPGEPCDLEGHFGCDDHASKTSVQCDGGTWKASKRCDADQRCSSAAGEDQGACVTVPDACSESEPEAEACAGNARVSCNVDLTSAEPIEECGAGYECTVAGTTSSCIDADECTAGTNDCDQTPKAACSNTDGSFSCKCPSGYQGTGHGTDGCVDIDECAAGTATCDTAPAACVDNDGSYTCKCPVGFSGNGTGKDGCYCNNPRALPYDAIANASAHNWNPESEIAQLTLATCPVGSSAGCVGYQWTPSGANAYVGVTYGGGGCFPKNATLTVKARGKVGGEKLSLFAFIPGGPYNAVTLTKAWATYTVPTLVDYGGSTDGAFGWQAEQNKNLAGVEVYFADAVWSAP